MMEAFVYTLVPAVCFLGLVFVVNYRIGQWMQPPSEKALEEMNKRIDLLENSIVKTSDNVNSLMLDRSFNDER